MGNHQSPKVHEFVNVDIGSFHKDFGLQVCVFGSKSSSWLMIKMCGAHNSLTFQSRWENSGYFFSNLQIFRKSPTWKSDILWTWCFLSVDMELWGPFCLLIKAVCCSLLFRSGAATKSYVEYIVWRFFVSRKEKHLPYITCRNQRQTWHEFPFCFSTLLITMTVKCGIG